MKKKILKTNLKKRKKSIRKNLYISKIYNLKINF
jgi:hypothetical protein